MPRPRSRGRGRARSDSARTDPEEGAAPPPPPPEQEAGAPPPLEEDIAAPADEGSAVTVDEEAAAPADEETAAPADEESAEPVDEESAAPVEEESAAPVDEETAAPADEVSAKPVEEESAAPVDQERADTDAGADVVVVAVAGEDEGATGGEAERTRKELERKVTELSIQNEYLKSQIAGPQQPGNSAEVGGGGDTVDEEDSELVRSLKEQVERLSREVQEQKQTQKVAEAALEHVNVSYAEADGKVQELTTKLTEAQLKMEKELKERDDKYVELDTKFQRLHKRAKQRIQDIQKEKDDLEARFNEINQKAEQAASLQLAAQQEMERARHQASEALRAMDAERQQLRTVNSKLRSNFDETRLALEARNNALEKLQQSMLEKEQISRLESEFSAYKTRAHALLQKKDAELSAAQNSDLLKAHEEAIREAEKEVAAALEERDEAIQDLQAAQSRHSEEIEARDLALADMDKKLKNVMKTLDSVTSQFLSEKESWEKDLASVEESWRLKCESMKDQSNGHVEDHLQKNLGEWTLKYEKLKEEHESFRDISDRMIEEKEREIAKLLKENKDLHHSLEAKAAVSNGDNQSPGHVKQDLLSIELAEQQILFLARQQAQREEELGQSQRHILALQQEIEELERENRLHDQQEAMLKTELRNMERSQKREGIDMTYLKNVILKLLETGEVGALLPVVATLLQFSPDELNKCQHGVLSSVASSAATALSDGGSTPNSFFGRFTF